MIRHPSDDREQTETLRAQLAEAEDMLRAIRRGEIDALVVEGAAGHQVYTLHNAEEPYRNLVEQMPEGAVVLTRRGDILYANARFAELGSTGSFTRSTGRTSRGYSPPAVDGSASA